MKNKITPFRFFTRFNQVELLPLQAKNLIELLEGIKTVPDSSIYYHTHKFLQQHHYLSPEPPNDFTYWITNVLQEATLGEKIASVNIIQFATLSELREKFIQLIEEYLKERKLMREVPQGAEFHFMACRSFILPTDYLANNLSEFKDILERISIQSLYFHIFEARLRLGKVENDFSLWLRALGKEKIAQAISRLDPYTHTLEGLRKKIITLIEKHD